MATIEQSALELAEELAREAIELAADTPTVIRHKADALDVVTAADVAIEQRFRARIGERFPGHAILGEEQGIDGRSEWTWILDPIDGTFNYATRFTGTGSAIALMQGDEVRIGVIADLALGTVVACRRGGGLVFSGEPPSSEIGRERLFVDPGHNVPDPHLFGVVERLAALAPVVPRMVGSAAVSLAAVAVGGGCFVGAGLEIWDAAAGMLLVEERGCPVRWWRFEGDSFHHVLAGEPELVRLFEPLMPDFIEAWRAKTTIRSALLGPSTRILIDDEGQ